MIEQEMNSEQFCQLEEQFNFELNLLRQKLTFQLYADLKSVEDKFQQKLKSTQSEGQSLQTYKNQILQQQSIFVKHYQKTLKEIQKIHQQANKQVKERQIHQAIQQLENQKDQRQQMNLVETIQVQKQLLKNQTQIIKKIKNYLNSLFDRIKQQSHLQKQRQISKYLQTQKEVFLSYQGNLEHILKNFNNKRKNWYNMAKEVCLQKQAQIKSLQDFNEQIQRKINKEERRNNQLTEKQQQIYTQISKLQLELNIKSLGTKSQSSERNTLRKSSQKNSQNDFKQKNLGSFIYPVGNPEKENISSIFLSQKNSNVELQRPTCQIISSMENEVNKKKYPILILFLLTFLLWFI